MDLVQNLNILVSKIKLPSFNLSLKIVDFDMLDREKRLEFYMVVKQRKFEK